MLPLLLASSPGLDMEAEVEKGWVKKAEVCEREERRPLVAVSSPEPSPW